MSVSDSLITAGLRALGMVCRSRSKQGRTALGSTVGRAMLRADRRRALITRMNVDRAFPELPAMAKEAIVQRSYENLGITLAELLAVPSMSEHEVRNAVRFDGIEQLTERVRQEKPTILLSGHMGNWELLAMSGALQARTSFAIVVHPLKNRSADRLLNSYRTRFGNTVVPMGDAARTLVRVLQGGGTVAFLADQHANPEKDSWIPFFGRATPTYDAPAALALRFNIPMLAAFAVRTNDGTYRATMHRIPSDDLSNNPSDVRTLTQRHVQALEDAIRQAPGMWSWQHRRWREEQS